jgi:hypothetical protein
MRIRHFHKDLPINDSRNEKKNLNKIEYLVNLTKKEKFI